MTFYYIEHSITSMIQIWFFCRLISKLLVCRLVHVVRSVVLGLYHVRWDPTAEQPRMELSIFQPRQVLLPHLILTTYF